jgi:outer membrane protein
MFIRSAKGANMRGFLKISIVSATVLCLAVGASAQQSANKVGVISMQGAIVGTKDGQKAQQQLEGKFEPKKKEFDGRNAEITQLEDQLSKGGTLISEDKKAQLARDIDEKKRRLQRDVQDAQEEMQSAQQQVLSGLVGRIQAVVEKYAKDNGYTMILDVSNQNTPVLFASSGIDITQDIIALYDKTTTNGTPSAAAPGTPGTASTSHGAPSVH